MQLKKNQRTDLIEKLPLDVKKILTIFDDDARLVGGCVRDLLLEKTVHDFDFATKLTPEKTIKKLQKNNIKAIPTGIKFGTITAVLNGKNYEITTLRKDVENFGRGAKVEFIDDYFFDASRRDFTINALYLDLEGFIYDYFDGILDLEKKQLKFIGDENNRINEDFLRILRFLRFTAKYATNIDEKGLNACIKHKENIKLLSANRVRDEIFKVLAFEKNENIINFFEILEKSNISKEIFPNNLEIENLKRVFYLEESLKIKLSLDFKFFILINQKNLNLEMVFDNFNFSNNQKKYFNFLFDKFYKTSNLLEIEEVKELFLFEAKDFIYDFLILNYLQNANFDTLKNLLNFINNFQLPDFPLNGEDFMDLGFKGKEIGFLIKKTKIFWAKNDFSLNKNELISFLKNIQLD